MKCNPLLAALSFTILVVPQQPPRDPSITTADLRADVFALAGDETEGRAIGSAGYLRAAGYAIGHPWVFGRPPGLNARLGALPSVPAVLHLHDIAVLPAARGTGAASRLLGEWVELAHAAGLSGLSLVAVGDAAAFWARRGFAAVEGPRLEQTPQGYGANARYMVRGLR